MRQAAAGEPDGQPGANSKTGGTDLGPAPDRQGSGPSEPQDKPGWEHPGTFDGTPMEEPMRRW
eukprot:16291361-Heterocapsa_arctica.AAC.1